MDRQEARRRAEALVSQMTLEEKASQLRYDAPAVERLGIPAYNWWNEALHGVARAGTATMFPQAIGLAAIFDEEFQEKVGDVVSTEGRAKYNGQSAMGDRDIYKGLTFWSPNINIFRDPRWGRGHETLGEDPFLTSRLGVAYIRGLQGHGEYLKTAACAKHFAVHSGPEAIRHEFDAVASPKDMEETYLPAFQAAVEEGHVEAVMGAYNRVNGEPACGSRTLLKETLRGKWHFEGHVVSDCWAISDFHKFHHVTDTAPESAALAINNGCDVNCGDTYLHLLQAVQEGRVTEETITESCVRAMTTRFLLGMFDEHCPYDAIGYEEVDTDAHDQVAQTAAEKSMVLLKNDGLLPLDPGKIRTIAVIGPNADSRLALAGNYHGTSSRSVTMLQGIRDYAASHGIRVFYSSGCSLVADREEGLARMDDRLSEALLCASGADVVIACVGLDETLEGEQGDTSNFSASGDKRHLHLPDSQVRLMEALEKTGKPLVTVVLAGSSLNVPQGNAQLLAWYPGQAGGRALARILFGEVSPSGKLPLTFYRRVEDLPEFTDYSMKGRTYRYYEGEVLYPFGYGLTYVPFGIRVSATEGDRVTVRVENLGSAEAENVVQVYTRSDSPLAPPNPRLSAFARVCLKAGETKEITLKVDPLAFTEVNEKGERIPVETLTGYVGFQQPGEASEKLTGQKTEKVCLTRC